MREPLKQAWGKIWKIALIGATLPLFVAPYIQEQFGYSWTTAIIITEFAYAIIAYYISTKYEMEV